MVLFATEREVRTGPLMTIDRAPDVGRESGSDSEENTVGGAVARELGLSWFNADVLYNAIALNAITCHIPFEDKHGVHVMTRALVQTRVLCLVQTNDGGDRIARVHLNGLDMQELLYTPDVKRGASIVKRHPKVQKLLMTALHNFARNTSLVVGGRDLGINVFPKATLKIYLAKTRMRSNLVAQDAILIDTRRLSHERIVEDIVSLARHTRPTLLPASSSYAPTR